MESSPDFTYKKAKELDDTPIEGSTLLWVCRISRIYGNCPEKEFPSDLKETDPHYQEIFRRAQIVALNFRTAGYQRLYTLEDFTNAIYFGHGASISFDLFVGAKNAPKGLIPLPHPLEKSKIGHSVALTGYSGTEEHFVFANSWGKEWGDQGMGYLPYEYFNRDYIIEGFSMSFGFRSLQKPESFKTVELEPRYIRNKKFTVKLTFFKAMRVTKYPLIVIDIYDSRGYILLGYAHCSNHGDKATLEIEDLFVHPEYRHEGIGKNLVEEIFLLCKRNKIRKIVGWISVQDLVNEREIIVKKFFKKMKFKIYEDHTRFRDCWYRIESGV